MGWRGPLTHRQYLAWQAWRRMDLDRPNRTDHYLMQLSHEVRYSHPRRRRRPYRGADYQMRFTWIRVESDGQSPSSQESQPVNVKEESERLKANTIAQLGGRVRRVTKDRDGNVIKIEEPPPLDP